MVVRIRHVEVVDIDCCEWLLRTRDNHSSDHEWHGGKSGSCERTA